MSGSVLGSHRRGPSYLGGRYRRADVHELGEQRTVSEDAQYFTSLREIERPDKGVASV